MVDVQIFRRRYEAARTGYLVHLDAPGRWAGVG
jgi:hypothetical protein